MTTRPATPNTVDEYLAAFPPDVRAIFEQIRATIQAAAPGAQEAIRYQMPVFTLNGGYLAHIAAYKRHIGLYPAPTEAAELAGELSAYLSGKSTLRFPLDRPIPLDLIRRIVLFRVRENAERASAATRRP